MPTTAHASASASSLSATGAMAMRHGLNTYLFPPLLRSSTPTSSW